MNKKIIKTICFVIPVVLVLLVVSNNVFAFNQMAVDKINSALQNAAPSASAQSSILKVWGTVLLILQILSVAAIVIAGIRYMFASADGKADIKKQTIGLMVGAVLVFGASSVIGLITNITSDIAPEPKKKDNNTNVQNNNTNVQNNNTNVQKGN